jgi:hypothetical protein
LVLANACQSQNDDELQALLHDDPLTQATTSALTAPSDGGAGTTGAAGNVGTGGVSVMTGAAGTTGIAGTGFGGTTGIAGTGFGGTTGIAGTGFGGTTGIAGTGFGGTGTMDGGFGGQFDGGPPPTLGPLGRWSFDDCNTSRTELFDSGPNFDTAFRSVSVTCTTGVSNQAVALADRNQDLVYVPDQPFFSFSGGVTVAGWFTPTSTNQTSTLFRKRDDGTSSAFALVINGGRYQFVVNLGNGRAATVIAPTKAKAGQTTHVGATYDGSFVRLYLGGVEVATQRAVGTLAPAPGPFLMGNDGSKRLFPGSIDEAFLDLRALSAAEMLALTCLHRQPAIVGTPAESPPVTINIPASYDIALTNNDTPSCGPGDFLFEVEAFTSGININPSFQFVSQVPAGGTVHIPMTVTGVSDDLDTGTFPIPFFAFTESSPVFFEADGSVNFNFVASGCRVSKPRELMITTTSVVDDPIRTVFDANSTDPRNGVWTFKHLMESIAPTPADAPAMVEAVMQSFGSTQTINGFNVDPRPGMQNLVLGTWPRTPDGALDLAQAPLTLQAIVDRFDLRNPTNGDAGEGRFVFAFHQSGNPFPLQATMIFEYKLPAATADDVTAWANRWHALGSLSVPSEAYNAALQAITEMFAGPNARPDHTNGSAINAVRTNEIDFGNNGVWQLREFGLAPDTKRLAPTTIKLTPDLGFNNTDTLASFINTNEAAILAETVKDTDTIPLSFNGSAFRAGAVFNDFFTRWNAPGINNLEARFNLAVNTCNGCHSIETGVDFLQIIPRFPGGEAGLSLFLTGTSVFDPFEGISHSFGDLDIRAAGLRAIVCPNEPPPPPGDGGAGTGGSSDGGVGGAGGRATGMGGFGGAIGRGDGGVAGSTGTAGRMGIGGTTGRGSTGAGGAGGAF